MLVGEIADKIADSRTQDYFDADAGKSGHPEKFPPFISFVIHYVYVPITRVGMLTVVTLNPIFS
jgi:hypothetical protein